MNQSNNPAAIAMMVEAIQDVLRGLHGQLGGPLTPDAKFEGRSIRDWLDGLTGEIKDFLKK